MYLHDGEEGFSRLVILSVVPVCVLVGVIFLYGFSDIGTKQQTLAPYLQTVVPKVTPSPWKTYHNGQYNFDVRYPSTGVIAESDAFTKGECGNAIKVGDNKNAVSSIKLDNFFEIKIVNWDKSIDDYLKQQNSVNIYNIRIISNSGADESIALEGLKKGVEYARGFPPLAYVVALYRKNDKLFILQSFQTPNNFGGCLAPSNVNPADYPEITGQEWNMTESLKF